MIDLHPAPILAAYQSAPSNYDYPYAGMVIEFTDTAENVEHHCGKNAGACTLILPNFRGDKCYILLPFVGRGGVSLATQELLRHHEVAHCNGWRH